MMDIKKALLFIESNATWETKNTTSMIVFKLTNHLNDLADLIGDKDKEISRLQGELDGIRRIVLDGLNSNHDKYLETVLEQARQEQKEKDVETIKLIMESHKKDAGDCDEGCDFVAAWESAIEAIRES